MDRLYVFFMFIPIVSFHGFLQAWTAERLGDDTARREGRLTLNPISHIDIWGTLIIPALGLLLSSGQPVGWGKLVPVSLRNLSQPRRDELLIAVMGPIANVVLAFLTILVGRLVATFAPSLYPLIHEFAFTACFLALVNLLPFPWFDGWVIVRLLFNFSQQWMEANSLWWWLGLVVVIQLTPLLRYFGWGAALLTGRFEHLVGLYPVIS